MAVRTRWRAAGQRLEGQGRIGSDIDSERSKNVLGDVIVSRRWHWQEGNSMKVYGVLTAVWDETQSDLLVSTIPIGVKGPRSKVPGQQETAGDGVTSSPK